MLGGVVPELPNTVLMLAAVSVCTAASSPAASVTSVAAPLTRTVDQLVTDGMASKGELPVLVGFTKMTAPARRHAITIVIKKRIFFIMSKLA